MLQVSLHASSSASSWSSSDGTISSRQAEGLDAIAEQLRTFGIGAEVVEAPVSEARASDFWIVLADDLDWHLENAPPEARQRFVILRPGRERAFDLLADLDAAAALEVYGSNQWAEPVRGRLAVRRAVADQLGGETRARLPFMKQTERHGSWEHPDYTTVAEHLVRYLSAIGKR